MKRLTSILVVALATISLATAAFAADWTVKISPSASGAAAGSLTIGAAAGDTDGYDSGDSALPPMPSPNVTAISYRPDADSAVTKSLSFDTRATWDAGTKVWSCVKVSQNGMSAGDTVTLNWTPSAGLPTGAYQMINLTDSTQAPIDLSKAGSVDLTVDENGDSLVATYMIIVTLDGGTAPTQIVPVTAGRFRIQGSAAADDSGNIFVSTEDGNIYKIAADGTVTKFFATGIKESVKGRIAVYGGNFYFTVGGKLFAVGANKTALFTAVALGTSTTSVSTPAVDAAGNIYVGTDAGIFEVSPAGAVIGSNNLGGSAGTVFAPAIPGTDLVWATAAGGNLYCLNSALDTIRNTTKLGAACSTSPAVMPVNGTLTVIGTGDKALTALNATTFAAAGSFAADDVITSSPFFTGEGDAFFAAANGKVYGVNLATMSAVANFPVTLPGTVVSTANAGVFDSAPVVFNGKIYIGAGQAGSGQYIIDIATGAVTMNAGTEVSAGSPTITSDGKVIFTNKDGNIYKY